MCLEKGLSFIYNRGGYLKDFCFKYECGKDPYLQSVTGEFFIAKFASGSSLWACVFQMVLHENPGDLGAAFAGARYGVMFARI